MLRPSGLDLERMGACSVLLLAVGCGEPVYATNVWTKRSCPPPPPCEPPPQPVHCVDAGFVAQDCRFATSFYAVAASCMNGRCMTHVSDADGGDGRQ